MIDAGDSDANEFRWSKILQYGSCAEIPGIASMFVVPIRIRNR
jgi:hypothetical protein